MTYIIAEPCIDIKDLSCVDVCPVDCIHVFDRMLIIDPEECIDCGACEPECPVEAIFPEDALPEKWEPFVKINYAYGDGADVINKLVDEYATSTTSRTRRSSRDSRLEEFAPGLWRWEAPHPEWVAGASPGSPADWPELVGSVAYEPPDAFVLIDPLVPAELWPSLEERVGATASPCAC